MERRMLKGIKTRVEHASTARPDLAATTPPRSGWRRPAGTGRSASTSASWRPSTDYQAFR
jgi:hypothetical protein